MNTKKTVRIFAALTMVAVMSLVTVNAQQKGDMAVGGDLSIGMGDDYTNVGIGGKFRYNIIDPVRLEGTLTLFLPKYETTHWDLSAYGHYLFNVADKLIVYPLAGLGVYGWSNDGYSGSKASITFGGGLDVMITDKLAFNAEMKYKIVDYIDRFIISAGITYKF